MTHRPAWLDDVARQVEDGMPEHFARFTAPANPRRRSAVLMLFGPSGTSPLTADGVGGVDVLLTERSSTLRSHAGQISFPGGAVDAGDDGPVGAALRESVEEVGLEPAGVDVVGTLPELYLSPSGNAVVPVLAWWREPGPVSVVDPAEVARVERVALTQLLSPSNRFTVVGPTGFTSPGFAVDGLFVWGFTALLLDAVLELAGLTLPWDARVRRRIPRNVRPGVLAITRYAVRRAVRR